MPAHIIHKHKQNPSLRALGLALLAATALSGCTAADRIANIGQPPTMAEIENPQLSPDYKPVSMPMPAPQAVQKQPNSLWASNRKNFFKDQRASDVGDILTVLVDIDEKAELDNETERKRSSSENAGLGGFLGYENSLGAILPESVDPTNLVGTDADSAHKGEGTIDRQEKIEVQLAALVTQILPNGNMVIHGKQEIRVNFEKRVLQIDGVIRPEDISIDNTVRHNQVAEARVVYGGEGQITDVQQPRYGQQLYDIVFPF
ncbi:MAG: flagellar basal body L-ring protein FlgH [Alphaproteobacteria bacterium]|nr:flagellar basal body L-ring protein FlgH [Alphaproteobacteria bacterium]